MPTTQPELAGALRTATMRLARRLRHQRTDASLSPTQLATLATLARLGSATPRELAGHEGVQPPTMTRVLAALEERGLVRRAPHPDDRRCHVLTPTPAATGMLLDDRRLRDAWLAARLAELTDGERDALARAVPVLERIGAA